MAKVKIHEKWFKIKIIIFSLNHTMHWPTKQKPNMTKDFFFDVNKILHL